MSTVIPPSPHQRVSYRNGILLDASDFQQEQHYHRSRLALALSRVHGFGTLAGLRVGHAVAGSPREDGSTRAEEELIVHPGIALDRAGHLVEIVAPQCLRLDRWLRHQLAQPDAVLKPYLDSAGQRYFVGDLFLSYQEYAQGLRPGFPEPAADATDSLVPSRANDAFELRLVPRDCTPEDTLPATPARRFPVPVTDRPSLLAAVYAAYEPSAASRRQEYPADFADQTAVFLARVRLRLASTPPPPLTRDASLEVVIDDLDRPLVTATDLLAQLLPD
ncbi:MAG: hypothetical protein ACYDC1_05845 [Limisphaerales bacterium]